MSRFIDSVVPYLLAIYSTTPLTDQHYRLRQLLRSVGIGRGWGLSGLSAASPVSERQRSHGQRPRQRLFRRPPVSCLHFPVAGLSILIDPIAAQDRPDRADGA